MLAGRTQGGGGPACLPSVLEQCCCVPSALRWCTLAAFWPRPARLSHAHLQLSHENNIGEAARAAAGARPRCLRGPGATP